MLAVLGGSPQKASTATALVWTTTPWTIPSNKALAINPALPSGDAFLARGLSPEPLDTTVFVLCTMLRTRVCHAKSAGGKGRSFLLSG
jgi:hypothetical protein